LIRDLERSGGDFVVTAAGVSVGRFPLEPFPHIEYSCTSDTAEMIMASRSSGSTPRSKKSGTRTLPPVTTVTNEEQKLADPEVAERDRAADGVVGEVASDVEITQSNLQHTSNLQERDLPSLSDSREARIAERAYWRAERRSFAPGHELEDWLHAEREIDSQK
jgi:hypothetical protein